MLWLVVAACQYRLRAGPPVRVSADCVKGGEGRGVCFAKQQWRGVSYKFLSTGWSLHGPKVVHTRCLPCSRHTALLFTDLIVSWILCIFSVCSQQSWECDTFSSLWFYFQMLFYFFYLFLHYSFHFFVFCLDFDVLGTILQRLRSIIFNHIQMLRLNYSVSVFCWMCFLQIILACDHMFGCWGCAVCVSKSASKQDQWVSPFKINSFSLIILNRSGQRNCAKP